MRLYPIMVRLEGRRCVVVGGGNVAERKTEVLVECGAKVIVISPEFTPEIEEWAEKGQISLVRRPFQAGDLAGSVVAIAATDDTATNEAVLAEGRSTGTLVNVVDVPELCDFFVPASVSRGDFQIAISTGGSSPMLAKRTRQALEREYGPEYAVYIEMLGRLRQEAKARVPQRLLRNQAEEDFLDSPALSLIRDGKIGEANQILDQCLARYAARNE